MAVNNNNYDIRATLLEIFEVIVDGIIDGSYDDESDENLMQVVTSLLSSIVDTAFSGNVQSPGSEPEETTSILDDAPLEDATGKDDENEGNYEESMRADTMDVS